MMDLTKRTPVKPLPWTYPYIPEGAVIEVGPRTRAMTDTEPAGKGQNARRHVFLNGEDIGYIEQVTRRGERPTHKGSRIVIVTGNPTEWRINRRPWSQGFKQMNEAAYRFVNEYLRPKEN